MRKILFVLACAAIFLAVSGYPAFATFGFPETYGVSIRSMAMGRAFTAVADDYSATYYNPAGLAQKDDTSLTFGVIQPFHNFDVTFADPTTNRFGSDVIFYDNRGEVEQHTTEANDGDDFNIQLPVLGINLNINRLLRPKINIPVNIQAGIFVGLPENFNNLFTLNNTPPDLPNFTAFGDPIEHFSSALGLGIEVKKDLIYFGMGTLIGAEMKGPRPFQVHSALMGGYAEHLEGIETFEWYILEADVPTYGVLGYTSGLLLTPFDKKLRIGLSYKEDIYSVNGDMTPIMVYTDSGIAINNIYVITDVLVGYMPEQYSFGLAYTFDRFTVSADAKYKKWSGFDYSRMFVILYDIDRQGVIETNPGYEIPDSPDFDDITDYSVGLEYRHSKHLTLMAGYEFRPTPVPDQSYRVTNYLDMDKNVFSLGANIRLSSWCNMDLLLQYMMLDDFKVYKTGAERGYAWGWNVINEQESYKVEGDGIVLGVSFEIAL